MTKPIPCTSKNKKIGGIFQTSYSNINVWYFSGYDNKQNMHQKETELFFHYVLNVVYVLYKFNFNYIRHFSRINLFYFSPIAPTVNGLVGRKVLLQTHQCWSLQGLLYIQNTQGLSVWKWMIDIIIITVISLNIIWFSLYLCF